MASAAMDAADEAGGEAVFTSDGLPSLTVPIPPPALSTIRGDVMTDGAEGGTEGTSGGDAVIEEENSDPRTAFEAFSDAGTGWIGFSNADAASSSSNNAWEDPRQRLLRLKSEIDRLEATLTDEKESDAKGPDCDGDLHAMSLELQSRLNDLGIADASSLATMLRGRQEDLTHLIARDMAQFGNPEGNDMSREMKEISSTENFKLGQGEGDCGKIVYELYRANPSSLTAPSAKTVPQEVLLEERLRKLELAMGSTDNEGGKSILERIEEAERYAKEVDMKQLDKVAAKAKVVRADLEAAARAKAKLAAKPHSIANKEDARTIAALHSQLIELEGLSAHLPALTARLVELSALHGTAAEFASRLTAAESALDRSERALASVDQALISMERGWQVNMAQVERNVQKLDEMLAKACQS